MNQKKEMIKGFSKLSKEAKMEWLIANYARDKEASMEMLRNYWHSDAGVQKLHDEFIENTVTNYYLPFGVAPNFLVNGEVYTLPLAIEESSVVAAAAKAANFWFERGGFKTTVLSTTKTGHVHFVWYGGDFPKLKAFVDSIRQKFFDNCESITRNMRARGGGILDVQVLDKDAVEPNYYQLKADFETCDSMGANFINSCLEEMARTLQAEIEVTDMLPEKDRKVQVIMSILSNFTPQCLVRAEVSCKISELNEGSGMDDLEFAEKFCRAIRVAEIEPYRAVTHNKGIMNGIDSVVIATGNDFRAVEACAHAYAARTGQYKSLSHAEIVGDEFRFSLELPLSLGTVGGITTLHPMVKFSHEILGNPNARELMQIVAAAGLAQNFSAIRSLITSGIQKGHMKMHLLNILNQLEATDDEKAQIVEHFKHNVVSFSAVVSIFSEIRGNKVISNQ